jgi:hypothetical protein
MPPELAGVLERALEKDRNDRFGHIAELRNELETVLVGDVLSRPIGAALAETVTEALRVVVPSRAGRCPALAGPADERVARARWRPLSLAAGILLLLGVGAGYTVMLAPSKQQATAKRGSTSAVDRSRPGLPAFTTTGPSAAAPDPGAAAVVPVPRGGRMTVRASPRLARRSAAVRSTQPRRVVAATVPDLPTQHAEAQSLPFVSTLAKYASSGLPVVSGTERSPIGGPASDGPQVAWKVTDVRIEVGDAGRLRWTYTVVIRQQTDAAIWLHNEERAAFGARFGTVETVAQAARLDPRAELRLAMATEAGGLALSAFRGADSELMWIWHRFRGTAESGEPVTIDVRFPVYAFGARPASEGGL